MKRLFAAIGLMAIAACSTAPNNSIVPSGSPISTDTARHAPISALFVQSEIVQNNVQPNKSKAIVIKSIGLSGSINGTPGNVYFNTKPTCKVVDKGGFATGC